MDFLDLTLEPLSVDSILKLVSSEKCGAVSIFVGTTRDNFEGKQVIKLEYEAYEPMAIKVMKSLCEEIRKKFKEIHNIAIYHRLGCVPVMEASIVIAISSPHRVDSLAAVQYCIENLKEDIFFSSSNDIENNIWSNVTTNTPSHLVQINASNEEIQNRIKKYADKKREQINLSNIKDFIEINRETKDNFQDDNISTCARVDAVLIKRKDSKSHLQVMRVQNTWGPQTKVERTDSYQLHPDDRGSHVSASTSKCGIEERISNAESRLHIVKPVPKDIYQRLKTIEDRLLELETISPEYSNFWLRTSPTAIKNETTFNLNDKQPAKKVKYSAIDIKEKIEAMERSKLI